MTPVAPTALFSPCVLKGIRYTIVNGGITFEESECTQATPGKFLRSYDTVIR